MSYQPPSRPTVPAETTAREPAGTLTVTAPPEQAGASVVIGPDATVVGRDPSCALTLSGGHISREHAVLRVRDGRVTVDDLGSTNGTRLNGARITGPTDLHDGDTLVFADVEAVFHRAVGLPATSPAATADRPASTPGAGASEPTIEQEAQEPARSLRQGLHQAPGFSVRALLLSVVGSVVGTILTSALGTGQWGTLAGAAIAPVVTATFANRQPGETGRARTAAIVLLSAGALSIAWAGFSLADIAAGGSVLPGAQRAHTFPVPDADEPEPDTDDDGPPVVSTGSASPRPGPGIEVTPQAVDCGSVPPGPSPACETVLTVTSTGTTALRITRVEVTGPAAQDFVTDDPTEACPDPLDPGESCTMTVRFTPSVPGEPREATLVIHQNLPLPDRGTHVPLAGRGDGDGFPPTRKPTGPPDGSGPGGGAGAGPDPGAGTDPPVIE